MDYRLTASLSDAALTDVARQRPDVIVACEGQIAVAIARARRHAPRQVDAIRDSLKRELARHRLGFTNTPRDIAARAARLRILLTARAQIDKLTAVQAA